MGVGWRLSIGSGGLPGLLPLGRQDRHRAAGLFDRRHRRFRGAPDRQRHLGLDLAGTEEPDPGLDAPQDPGLDPSGGINGRAGIELAGVDRSLHPAEVDLVEPDGKCRVFEATLGQAAVERHLAALEALDAHARTRGLALAAAAAGLAHARSDAATDAGAPLAGARPVSELVELHRSSPLLLLDHADEMLNLRDHAAGLRRVGQFRYPTDPVESQPDQGLALGMVAARGAARLLDLDRLAVTLAHVDLQRPS